MLLYLSTLTTQTSTMYTLLQIDSGSAGIGYLVIIFVSFLIGILITRWIFRIDTIVHYMKTQTELLIKIAKYNNVPVEDIYQALGRKMPRTPEK
jgi:hypothetical protein